MDTVESTRRYGPGSEQTANESQKGTGKGVPKNMHGYQAMSAREKAAQAQSQASLDRSIKRRAELTRRQRGLLEDLGESRHVWYQLRRHGSPAQVERWLKLAQEHSTWLQERQSEAESLRRQYLDLFQACRYYDAEFEDDEMKKRRAKTGPVTAV